MNESNLVDDDPVATPTASLENAGPTSFMPSLLDREIRTSEADAFGHQHFAKALESLVESTSHTPPYSIGLLGKWGTGKSSIKSLYLEGLSDDRRKDINKLSRSQKIHAVTFNAWRFGGENIRRALLRHVYMELGGDETVIMDALFNQVQRPTQTPKSWKDIWREVYDKWLWTLLQVLVVAAILLGLTGLAAWLFRLDDQWAIVTILGIQSLLVGVLLKYLLDAKRFAISRFATINRVELPTVSAEQFEKLLVDQILEYRKSHKSCERLVVFVDDLDRLSAEEMVGGLDAIRTFMEIPHEDQRLKDVGIVFVISCDEDRVADALANKRRESGADLPGVILTRTDARRYLDRIFQFRLEIPPFPRQDMRSFALEKLRSELPAIVVGIQKRGVSVEEVVSRMIHVGVQSPRNALHILNAFVESWWVAERREREGAGSDKRGALAEGAVTNHPLALAALCALRVDFPDFYGDLQREPDLIARFLEVFVHLKPMSDQPERVRFILEKYSAPLKDDSDDQVRRLKEVWRPLRQYLTSVASIPWPKSLQPLLLLSQDPVSRQIGDGAQRIYDAFVSGDVQGVLADLGRDKDDRKFDPEQIRWLRDLIEQIETEVDDYRDNANAVIASLVDRYPAEEAGHLLVPLARRLTGSPSLRARVGVGSVPSILPYLPQVDQTRVAGSYIQDLLLPSGDIAFTLPTGETPSLDEAVGLCRTTVDLALSVRSASGLDSRDDQRLLDWLVSGHVGIAGKVFTFGFEDLETWMEEHERHLLPALGDRYLSLVADALDKKENHEYAGMESTVRRVDRGLSDLWERGEESRTIAWDLVCRYVRVAPPSANEVVQRFFRTHIDQAPLQIISTFVQNAAGRVLRFIGAGNLDEADTDAVRILITTASTQSDVTQEAVSKMVDVCIELSKYENKAQLATDLASSLIKSYPSQAQRIFEDWATRAMTDLPQPCLVLAASYYVSPMGETARTSLAAEMTKVVQVATPDSDQSLRYLQLVNGIPEDAFEAEPLNSHFVTAMAAIGQQFSNSPYLQAIFPAAPKIVRHASRSAVGKMLHTLMANARNHPDAYQCLHQIMLGNWPAKDEALAPYDPANIYLWAFEFLQNNPSHIGSGTVLLSMENLLRDGLVDKAQEEKLVTAAISIWPHHHQVSGEVLQRINTVPDVEIVAALASPAPADSAEHADSLQAVWKYFAGKYNLDQRIALSCALLGRSPEVINGHPDGSLYLWCDVIMEQLPSIFEHISENSNLTDDQKLRLWKQVEARITTLPQENLIPSIRQALLCNVATAKSVLEVSGEIDKRFDGRDAKHELAKELLTIYPNALNLESKRRIAHWVKSFGNDAVLRHVVKEAHSREDIEILLEHFPGNKQLEKALKE